MSKPVLQVINNHVSVTCRWLSDEQRPHGTKRYSHPDCEIWFQGRRTEATDYAVMLALQDCRMRASALRYVK